VPSSTERKAGTLLVWHGLLFHRGANGCAMHWILNPIESFFQNDRQDQDNLLVPEGLNEKPFEDDTLREVGQRAFDVIHDRCGESAETKDGLKEIIFSNTEELIKLYNGLVKLWNPLIAEGRLQLLDRDTGQLLKELTPLVVDIKKFGSLYEVETSIWFMNDIVETLALRSGDFEIPYDREFVAAIFTLIHVNDSTLGHLYSDCQEPDAHSWAVRWFEKLEGYERTVKAIQASQKRNSKAKSETMNLARHARRNEAFGLVTKDWNGRRTDFRSAEKAGQYYADWLSERGFEFEPRTITSWIRKFAKENNIILR